MKLRFAILILLGGLLLTGCNFTLAEDVTPPPDYVPPTAMPTLGPTFPSSAPDVQAGAAIFAQNCAACHGDKGLGDGPQSMQLPVSVPAIGLADTARGASPAEWYKIVTQGNLDRFMPPFVGALSDQERWDVVSYVLTLHTTQTQVTEGKSLFDADCPNCASQFSDQKKMSALSEDDLVGIIKNGQGDIPAFGKDYSDEQARAAAAYVRTLTFGTAPEVASASTPAVGTTEPSAAENLTPEAGAGSSSTPEAAARAGNGTVSGSIQVSGGNLPSNLTVTLYGFDHTQDQSGNPQQMISLQTTAAADGTFQFENVAMPDKRAFVAEVEYNGIKYRSGISSATSDSTSIELAPVKLYETSDDLSLLDFTQVHILTDFATAGTVQFLEIYSFSNSSNKTVIISKDNSSVNFIQLPAEAQNVGFQMGQDSAPLTTSSGGQGVAAVPSDTPYSIIAFFNLPYTGKLRIDQPFNTNVPSLIMLIPEGLKVSGQSLTDRGTQTIQNNSYQEFSASDLKAGSKFSFSLSGHPSTSSATGLDTHQGLLFGGGALGVVMILAGVFLYLRDRRREVDVEDEEPEFDSSDEVMDAILALDDLHRAGKISDEAYQSRRAELKEILKEMA